MDSRPLDIIVSGHLCLDLIPSMSNVPLSALSSPGRLFEVGSLTFSTGGAVSNTGLALHRLGVNVRLMATVGDDLVGQVIVAFVESRDPSLRQLIRVQAGQASSYTVVLSPENVDRIFLHCPCTNSLFGAADIDYHLLSEAKIFHLGYPPILPRLVENDGEELEAIYRQARETGIITSLDTSMPDPQGASGQADWIKILRRTLPFVDIFIPSIEEILFMLRYEQYTGWRDRFREHLSARFLRELADEILDMGVKITGFKLGDLGIYLQASDAKRLQTLNHLPIKVTEWAGKSLYHPAFEVDVAGTTGAGDSAYAGLLAAMLKGMSIKDTARWACAVGACNVEAPDATSGIRTWESTRQRLESGWKTRLVNISSY